MPTHETGPERHRSEQLSELDPPPDAGRSRPPVLLIVIIVLLLLGFVVLHLTGVVGPANH